MRLSTTRKLGTIVKTKENDRQMKSDCESKSVERGNVVRILPDPNEHGIDVRMLRSAASFIRDYQQGELKDRGKQLLSITYEENLPPRYELQDFIIKTGEILNAEIHRQRHDKSIQIMDWHLFSNTWMHIHRAMIAVSTEEGSRYR